MARLLPSLCVQLLLIVLSWREHSLTAHAQKMVPDEQRLIRKLMRGYDSSARPVFNASQNVAVNFGLTLIQIIDMDERNQVIVTNVWLEHEWLDERLTWDPLDYNGLIVLRLPANKLWLPDIVLYNKLLSSHPIFDADEPLPAEFIVSVTDTEVALEKVKVNKATGPDNIPPWVLKAFRTFSRHRPQLP
ncbi:Neuronal acetylcholine receptor subunit alpha-4 [Lamellibrachia satsuma]|nr:Neuronal acetylcholine receptor subunit alpha-4 [Lamellibrachia satsuma]